MRKLLLACVGVAGIAGATGCAQAAEGPPYPVTAPGPVPVLTEGAQVQPVQYYDDWRYREWRRRERFERWRRHEEWRRQRYEQERYRYGSNW